MITEIQKLDFNILNNSNHPENKLELDRLKNAVSEYGFLILKNSRKKLRMHAQRSRSST